MKRPAMNPGMHRSQVNSHSRRDLYSVSSFYVFIYTAGIRFLRCLKAVARFTRQLWKPLVQWVAGMFKQILRRKENRPSSPKAVTGIFNRLAPLAALCVLVLTLYYWVNGHYALSLTYAGTPIGLIDSQTTYVSAADLVQSRVINGNNSFSVIRTPSLQITLSHGENLLDDNEVCERIITSLGDSVTQATGLYVDGIFQGALAAYDEIEAEMNTVLAPYASQNYDTVGFFGDVSLVQGLYPTSALISRDTLREYLNTLPVETVTNISYTEIVKYSVIVKESDALPLGYTSRQQKGVNGKRTVAAQIIRVNGVEKYRTVISTKTLVEAIPEINIVGVQKYSVSSELGDGLATGSFIWPLPFTKTVSSSFASRWGSFHGAIDISRGSSTFGKPIIASDGGVVLEARYHSSYGYYVLIDHGNGYKTRYAHCSHLEVTEGDKVAQGQYIAKVGNTGYSLGAHLHFEIIKNGVLVDPLHYVER